MRVLDDGAMRGYRMGGDIEAAFKETFKKLWSGGLIRDLGNVFPNVLLIMFTAYSININKTDVRTSRNNGPGRRNGADLMAYYPAVAPLAMSLVSSSPFSLFGPPTIFSPVSPTGLLSFRRYEIANTAR